MVLQVFFADRRSHHISPLDDSGARDARHIAHSDTQVSEKFSKLVVLMGLLWAYWLGSCLLKQCDSHLDLKLRLGFTIEGRLDKTLFLSSPGKWCFLFKWISTTNSRIWRRLTINSRRCIWTCSMHVFFFFNSQKPHFPKCQNMWTTPPLSWYFQSSLLPMFLKTSLHAYQSPFFSTSLFFNHHFHNWLIGYITTRAAQIYGGFSWFFMFVTLW